MIGFDTGFFVKFAERKEETLSTWQKIENGKENGVISVVTLYELRTLALKGAMKVEFEEIKNLIYECLLVVPLTPEIADRAAFLSHGTGIHMADALILASLLEAGCKEVYTDNIAHLGRYKGKEVKIVPVV